jgi:hypothetical protein
MNSGSVRLHRTVTVIILVSAWFSGVTCFRGFGAAVSSSDQLSPDARFKTFKQDLERRINERIAAITDWMPAEAADRLDAVIIAVREPMRERLDKTKKHFLSELDEEAKKAEIQKALTDQASIAPQVDKYFSVVNERLMRDFRKARAELAAHLNSQPGILTWTVTGLAIISFLGLLFLVSRPLQTYYFRKPGFAYSKIWPDGTKEWIEGYAAPEATAKVEELVGSMQKTINDVARRVDVLYEHDQKGMGYIYGVISFAPSEPEKSGVKVSLVGKPEVSASTSTSGFYFLHSVPPGNHTLNAEKEGYKLGRGSRLIYLKPKEVKEAPHIQLIPDSPPDPEMA